MLHRPVRAGGGELCRVHKGGWRRRRLAATPGAGDMLGEEGAPGEARGEHGGGKGAGSPGAHRSHRSRWLWGRARGDQQCGRPPMLHRPVRAGGGELCRVHKGGWRPVDSRRPLAREICLEKKELQVKLEGSMEEAKARAVPELIEAIEAVGFGAVLVDVELNDTDVVQ